MHVILLDTPVAGKVIQAQVLVERLGSTHIATGELLRSALRAQSPLGIQERAESMHVILLGAPGSGKGTQAQTLVERLGFTHIAVGEILRSAVREQSPLGIQVQAVMAKGELVPDHLIIALVQERLQQAGNRPCLLDGFPRTLAQAEALTQAGIRIDQVVHLAVPEAALISRLGGRRVHLPSGRLYHIEYQPPRVADRDDITGEPLTKRPDDEEETIRHRLGIYQTQTAPLIAYYQQQALQGRAHYVALDADQTPGAVSAQLLALFPQHTDSPG
jgi:adenylate kinase